MPVRNLCTTCTMNKIKSVVKITQHMFQRSGVVVVKKRAKQGGTHGRPA